MIENRQSLEVQWNAWELELKDFEPISPERRRALFKIAGIWAQLATLSEDLQKDYLSNDKGLRYLGLNALKIAALNRVQKIEGDEVSYMHLCLQLTHNLILTNILRLRLHPGAHQKLKTQFQPEEISLYLSAKELFTKQEKDLWADRNALQKAIADLKEEYEMFVFTESSYEAARSFGTKKPDIESHRSSWNAFSQLLTSMALSIHEEQRGEFIKRCGRINAQREQLFESCRRLLEKQAAGKDVKRVQRQLRHNVLEITRLEKEINTALSELSVPGLGDQVSLRVKINPEQVTTFQRIKLSQTTGDKT